MLLPRLYYTAKPWLPQSLRLAVRRWHARRLLKRSGDVWPILESAGRTPDGWPGWPDNKQFALVLTHDVEGPRGLDNVKPLAELEMSLGFRSAFYFIPEGPYRVPPALRHWLTDNDFEVGVHDLHHDGKLYRSRAHFKRCAERINRYLEEWQAVGFRSGFMLRQLDWLHDLNIQYDASTFDTDPFEPQPDGVHTIFPFWVGAARAAAEEDRGQRTEDRGPRVIPESDFRPPSTVFRRTVAPSHRPPPSALRPPCGSGRGYIELPYTLPQDSTLFRLLGEPDIQIWTRKLNWIAEHGGMALLDSHPDYMTFGGESTLNGISARHYADFLKHVRRRYRDQAWCGLPMEIASQVCQTSQRTDHETTSPSFEISRPTPTRALRGKRAAVLLFSYYAGDPRPRRAAEALAGEGMAVDVICLRADADEPLTATLNGVHIRRVPMRRHRGSKVAYLAQYFGFISICFVLLGIRSLRRRYHLVHVHNMPDVLVFSALTPKLLGAKIILDLHDPMPELMMTIFHMDERSRVVRQLERLEHWSIAMADSVLTVNEACRRIFGGRSCHPSKVQVIMNSPDEHLFPLAAVGAADATQQAPADRFVVMYHGSLVERHGLDLAVEAMARLRPSIPGLELRVYGARTAFLDMVMASVEKQGLQDVVQHLGPRRIEDIPDAIRHCDLGIIPNRSSIFTRINTPTRIFEYLSCGKPVIAPDVPGIRDYFRDQDLLFFELGNPEDLARQIEFAFHHPEQVQEIVSCGQIVYRAHQWTAERESLLDHVDHLLNGHPQPAKRRAQIAEPAAHV